MTRETFSLASNFTSRLLASSFIAAILLLSGQTVAALSSNEEMFRRGLDALGRADYQAAETAFQSVLKSEPKNLGALSNLGVVYSRTHRPGLAVRVYRQALEVAPHDPSLLLNLGLAYLKQQDYPTALIQFLEVERLDATNLQAKELIATSQIFSKAARNAIPRLEALRSVDPNQTGLLYLLGVAYTRTHQQEKAKAALTELLTHTAGSEESALLLGQAYYDSGQFEDAERTYTKALTTDAGARDLRLGLAKTLISERKNGAAQQELSTLLRRNAADPDAHYYLGALLLKQDPAAALPHLLAAEKAFPNSDAVAFYLGRLAMAQYRYADAITHLRRATELNDDNEPAYYALVQALRATNQTAAAHAALEHVRSAKQLALQHEQDALSSIPPAQ